MPIYVIYDEKNGNILQTHREYLKDSEKTLELNPYDVLKEFKDLLPKNVKAAIIAVDEQLKPKRGYRYYVDLSTRKLMLVEHDATIMEENK